MFFIYLTLISRNNKANIYAKYTREYDSPDIILKETKRLLLNLSIQLVTNSKSGNFNNVAICYPFTKKYYC